MEAVHKVDVALWARLADKRSKGGRCEKKNQGQKSDQERRQFPTTKENRMKMAKTKNICEDRNVSFPLLGRPF